MTLDSGQDIAVVDFGAHELEAHVERALHEAWIISDGVAISAADLLRACLTTGGSPAFSTLRNLLPPMPTPRGTTPQGRLDLKSVALERPLANSYNVANSFLLAATDKMFWGRDLVTMALLTQGDQSLQAFVDEANTTLDDLR